MDYSNVFQKETAKKITSELNLKVSERIQKKDRPTYFALSRRIEPGYSKYKMLKTADEEFAEMIPGTKAFSFNEEKKEVFSEFFHEVLQKEPQAVIFIGYGDDLLAEKILKKTQREEKIEHRSPKSSFIEKKAIHQKNLSSEQEIKKVVVDWINHQIESVEDRRKIPAEGVFLSTDKDYFLPLEEVEKEVQNYTTPYHSID